MMGVFLVVARATILKSHVMSPKVYARYMRLAVTSSVASKRLCLRTVTQRTLNQMYLLT